MKMKKIFVTASMLVLLLTAVSWAQDSALTISGMTVEPGAVGPGGQSVDIMPGHPFQWAVEYRKSGSYSFRWESEFIVSNAL